MKNFQRENLSFSLCGLNCALCTMKLDDYCPGCGGGAGNQGCSIARCSMQKGNYQYCFECNSYPCKKYDGITRYDSFITHRKQLLDMEKAKAMGIDAYNVELEEKAKILKYLLSGFNDGRRKTFFCIAVNLFDIEDINITVNQIENEVTAEMSLKDKATIAVKHFNALAEDKGVILKLNKLPPKAKRGDKI